MTQRFLVVEDDDELSTLLRLMLKLSEWELCSAKSGPEALERVKEFQPTLVLLDVMLPGMDGVQVCQRLHANPATAKLPIVALTAKSDPETKQAMLEAGALEYWTKPVIPQELLANIRRVLGEK
jgi:two-component system cell cycle response regulator